MWPGLKHEYIYKLYILNTYDTFLPVIASKAENMATSKLALLESPAPKGTEEPISMSRYGIGPKNKKI